MPVTTRVLFSGVLFSLVSFAPACVPPWHPVGGSECSEGCGETDTEGDAGDPPLTTTSTVTGNSSASSGDDATSASASSGTGEEMTTGDAEGPPTISDHELSPATILFAGALAPKIWADHSDGVRMHLLEDGTEVELTRNEKTGVYEGEIPAYSAFQNGDDYIARFTPWRSDGDLVIEGEALELPYTIALEHDPGEEDLWDLDKSGGSGQVTAIDVLPGADVVELVTLGSNDSTCLLRRRDGSGVLIDVVDLLPGVKCKAVDLEVDDDTGELYLLLDGWTDAGWMWWLAKAPYFGATLKSVKYGGAGEEAHALALSAAGTMAVCGSRETPEPGDLSDAVVHIIRSDFSGYAKAFDHVGDKDKQHIFDERANDCAFDPNDDSRLVVVGGVFGQHVKNTPDHNRRFDAVYDVETDHGDLRVATAGLATESVANSVAIDDEGRAWIVGFTSDGVSFEGQMWLLDANGEPGPAVSLGVHSSEALAPNTIRVSPAGYLVVASGGVIDSDQAFRVSAYAPLKAEPLFTFKREDAGLFHLAHALAIGPYGQIYAGGFGANGYPLFVIIYG